MKRRSKMILNLSVSAAIAIAIAIAIAWGSPLTHAGETLSGYSVLEPISHRNLTIFPVITGGSHDTSGFLTLDEGLHSGDIVVTEAGHVAPLIRRPLEHRRSDPGIWPGPNGGQRYGFDRVNSLVLVNNSDRPLLLLAGEIVTGGKQDRLVAKDRIVPAKSDPIDLGVFCVEPHRWVETADRFGAMSFLMAQPSVRKSAMADENQQEVWAQVGRSSAGMAGIAPRAAGSLRATSSYAGVMQNAEVRGKVEAVAAPLEDSYEQVMRELRARNAVGVVVAVNGRIIWADIFASSPLLRKYWPKLIRSYAAEALTGITVSSSASKDADINSARAFLDNFRGRKENVESEPGIYRQTEIDGEGFKVFALASLLPGKVFDIHVAKMAE